jgi:biotin carboxyl carrier protein
LRYEIEAGGRLRHVTIERAGGGFAVAVDGRLHHVDLARVDARSLSLIVNRGGASGTEDVYEAIVARDAGSDRLVVRIGAVPVAVALNGRGRRGAAAGTGAAASGPTKIVAPMPGKIVRILVQAGDAVSGRQPVAVVEAMKMENELRAGRDGTVAAVHVREGQSVEAGALLIVIQ